LVLELVLVGDDQLAGGAVAARLAEHERPPALHVDQQRELARVRGPFAEGTFAEPDIAVRIQDELVMRRQIAQPLPALRHAHTTPSGSVAESQPGTWSDSPRSLRLKPDPRRIQGPLRKYRTAPQAR